MSFINFILVIFIYCIDDFLFFLFLVTAVDSGIRALQFLGLVDEKETSESNAFVVCANLNFLF